MLFPFSGVHILQMETIPGAKVEKISDYWCRNLTFYVFSDKLKLLSFSCLDADPGILRGIGMAVPVPLLFSKYPRTSALNFH